MKSFAILALLPVVAGCTSAQVSSAVTTAQQAVTIGQLVCQVGPQFLAMVDTSGAAILAKGASQTFVTQACAAVNGVAAALPAAAAVATAAITPPAS